MDVSLFDYPLPQSAIAQEPVEPRHDSRLLDARDLSDHRFFELPTLLAEGDLVVVNRTRVRPGRLLGVKVPTGGKVEALLVKRLDEERWEALLRPARRIRRGVLLRFGEVFAEVLTDPDDGVAVLELKSKVDVDRILPRIGEVPLPPYIRRPLADPERYQTIFASRPGSAAAPTAGLHFTPQVVAGLAEAGVQLASVELEVGFATFRPIAVTNIEDHRMHAERIRVDSEAASAVEECRRRGGRVVAIGTTVVRALESVATDDGRIVPTETETDLYIKPGFRFRVVDLLVTNFHLPRSSLLVLVAAFMGERWRDVYREALQRGYRFLSFGDAMLCEPSGDR